MGVIHGIWHISYVGVTTRNGICSHDGAHAPHARPDHSHSLVLTSMCCQLCSRHSKRFHALRERRLAGATATLDPHWTFGRVGRGLDPGPSRIAEDRRDTGQSHTWQVQVWRVWRSVSKGTATINSSIYLLRGLYLQQSLRGLNPTVPRGLTSHGPARARTACPPASAPRRACVGTASSGARTRRRTGARPAGRPSSAFSACGTRAAPPRRAPGARGA